MQCSDDSPGGAVRHFHKSKAAALMRLLVQSDARVNHFTKWLHQFGQVRGGDGERQVAKIQYFAHIIFLEYPCRQCTQFMADVQAKRWRAQRALRSLEYRLRSTRSGIFCFILVQMKPQGHSEIRDFILTILKKRVFLFSLILGFIALLFQLALSEFSLPQFYAFGFLFLGLTWAAYQAYRDLSLKYQKLLSSIAVDTAPRSNLSITFVNGNEYAYSISDPYFGQNLHITKMQKTRGVKSHFNEHGVFFVNGKAYYQMGKGSLEINLQIFNSGHLPLDVISVDVDNDLSLTHLCLFHEGLFVHGRRLQLPFHMDCGQLVTLQSRYRVSYGRGSHEALFAADFRFLPRSILHEVSISTVDSAGNNQTYLSELKTLSSPLIDLYVNQWQEYQQDEYLILAGHKQV